MTPHQLAQFFGYLGMLTASLEGIALELGNCKDVLRDLHEAATRHHALMTTWHGAHQPHRGAGHPSKENR